MDNLPEPEKKNYEKFLDSKRIEQNVYRTALEEGRELAERKVKETEARAEKAQAEEKKMLAITVQVLHESGMDAEQIAEKQQRPVAFILDILQPIDFF